VWNPIHVTCSIIYPLDTLGWTMVGFIFMIDEFRLGERGDILPAVPLCKRPVMNQTAQWRQHAEGLVP
jgi:hypothetical protein